MNRKFQASGTTYILGYCVLGAAIDVLLSGLLQNVDLFVLLFWTFGLTWLVFMAISSISSRVKIKELIKASKTIVFLNLSTLGSWLGLYIGLKFTEPSIMVAIVFGLAPIISLIIELCKKNHVGIKNIVVALSLLIVVVLLMILAVEGQRTNPFDSNLMFAIVLTGVCIITSVSIAAGTYIAKSLSSRGFTAANVQSFRFPLLILVCFFLLPKGGALVTTYPRFWLYLAIIVVLGNLLPLWMLQKGIETTNPLTTSIIINVSPLVTLILEAFDPSIKYSNMKLVVVLILLLVMLLANDTVRRFMIRTLKGGTKSRE